MSGAAAADVGGWAVAERPDFPVFFDAVWGDLVAFGTRSTGSAALAEEIAQEALTRVYARYPLIAEPRPYVFRVAANLVRKAWRDGQRTQPTDLADLPLDVVPAHGSDTLDAVRRLPDRLRDVVVLHYWADLSVEAVAEVTRRPVGTVKRRLHEARAQLAKALGEEQR